MEAAARMADSLMLFVFFYAALALLAAALIALFVAGRIYAPFVAHGFSTTGWLVAPRNPPANDGQPLQVFTDDGLLLRGTRFASEAGPPRGAIIFCHEVTSDRWSALPFVDDLRQQGFEFYCFDFRNHGESAAMHGYQPLPWLTEFELRDMQAVVDYVASEQEGMIGLLGLSRGGCAALALAARDRRIGAVVTDGAFTFDAMQVHYIRRFMNGVSRVAWLARHLPDRILVELGRAAQLRMARRMGCRFIDIRQAARQVRCPVLMIHGVADQYVPLDVAISLREAFPVRTRLWTVPGARHNMAVHVDRLRYARRIGRFFQRCLASDLAEPVPQRASVVPPPHTRRRQISATEA